MTKTKKYNWELLRINILNTFLLALIDLILIVISYTLYFLTFLIFESIFNKDNSYWFVSIIRIGIGILLFGISLIISRSKIKEIIKIALFTCSCSVLFVGLAVQLHNYLSIFYIVITIIYLITTIYFIIKKKEFIYYSSMILSIIPIIIYI